jgi:hypothetical protein
MACSLNRDQVLDLYELLYGEVIDRIKDSSLPPIDIKQLIKQAYDVVKDGSGDEVKALLYAQAIPDVFQMVIQDEEANDYLVESNFDFIGLAKMRSLFKSLPEVGKEIATPKKTKQEIDSEIKNVNKSKKDFVPDESVANEISWSFNEDNGAKVSTALATTLQFAYSMNPEEVSEEDRNKIDPDKKLFSIVIKSIVDQARQRSGNEDVTYNGQRISLTAQLSTNVPVDFLTQDDKQHREKYPNYKGIIALVTDPSGNPIFFKEDGTITDNPKEGRVVYQYLRRVNLVGDRLLLSNRADRHYNLVSPETLATRQKDYIEQESNGKVKVSKADYEQLVRYFKNKQDKEMNDLYQLRKLIEESDGSLQVILPILGGSFGIPSTALKKMTLEEAQISENDVKNYVPITTGKDKGKQFFIVQKTRPGGTSVDQQVFLSPSNTPRELAEKVADILTTTAELKGRQLTPKERQDYYEIFFNNAYQKDKNGKRLNTTKNGVKVQVKNVNNKQVLSVAIKGKEIDQEILYTEEGKQMIIEQLMNVQPILTKAGAEPGSAGYWSADVHFNNKYNKKTFTEYTIENNKIIESSKNYFDAIKSLIRVKYTPEDNAYENGLNAYLTYAIPEGTVDYDGILEVGREKPKATTTTKAKPKKDIEETKPVPKKKSRTYPNPPGMVRQDSPYAISMKQQIKDAGGKVENYKQGMKVKDLAEAVELTEEEIETFRNNALDASPDIKTTVKSKPLTKEEVEEKKLAVNPATRVRMFDDIMSGSSNSSLYKKKGLDRSKLRAKFLEKVFTSKKDRDAATTWWNNSPLSKFISLERITELVNSDAFATWAGYGITLYEGDGGTSVDLYHEAWHGFSQLFLTLDEKIDLYKKAAALPKYKGMTFSKPEDYEIIEEDIAEEFRDYAKSKGKKAPKSWLAKIFDKIYQFLNKLFGRTNKKQVATNLQDIETVKVLFDKLYRASENPEILSSLKPSMDNVIWGKLNRSKTINDNFTLEESKQVSDAMDSMMAVIFQNYNRDFNTTSAALKLLKDPQNKKDLYRDIYDRFERLRIAYVDELENDFDLILDPQFNKEYELLAKITDNFGNLSGTLEGKDKNNVIAYHMEKSRFRVLRDKYIEIEDPSNIEKSNLFKLNDGNSISAKELASEDTMMLLASIFKVTRENGEVVQNREGLFGLPELQNIEITWNRLAKILEGSFDEIDMYSRIFENSENYPELQQLQTLLPNPFFTIESAMGIYNPMEFESETNFWQDFKKPRIPFLQLNLNKDQRKTEDGIIIKEYEARIAKANFDVYQVIQDWKNNFTTADTTINPYISKIQKTGQNILNTEAIVKDFGINGVFNYKKGNEFLQALGIVLDQSSTAINSIITNPERPFANKFGLDRMYEVIKKVNKSTSSDALAFKKDPLTYLLNGLPSSLRESEEQSEDVQGRIRALAEVQNMHSDSYANFSVMTPEGNKVWEHMVDNTVTRLVTALNYAENWEQLTTDKADPNGFFKHMRWLNEENNTFSRFSKILNTIFDLDPMSPTYGEKISDVKITLQNVAGTQMIGKRSEGGTSTASMDATSKFLQEFHTMLLNGVEEFMRHASKNTAMGLTVDGDIKTYNGKKAGRLYVDVESFLEYTDGEIKGYDIMEGYLAGEAERIFRFQQDKDKYQNYAGYNRKVKRKDGKKTPVMAGQAFTIFDDILSEKVQKKLYDIIDKASNDPTAYFDFMEEMDNNPKLRDEIRTDVAQYFSKDTDENLKRLQKAKYIDKGLFNRIKVTNEELKDEEVERALIKAYTYNSMIHKIETMILAYGDAVQYNHAKEEFHKRNAGLASGGRGFRADKRAQIHISSLKNYYAERRGYQVRNYDGTFQTAIIKEMTFNSVMYKEYRDSIEEAAFERMKNRAKAKEYADIAAAEYFSSEKAQMKIADGQGIVSFETYRILKKLEGNWSDQQELLYRKVSLGENITFDDVVEFFPPYKLQYFGNIQATGLPITSFHKFSLAPIIPGVAKPGTPMYDLHEKMMKDQIDYVLFESGSKVSHLGTGDVVLNPDGTFNKNSTFTVNTIFAEYLKNQTEINSSYKGKSIFSTQLRKLILEGLYKQGKIKSTKYEDITNDRVKRYIDHVEEYTNLLKLELLEEMGYEETEPGQYKPKDKSSTAKLINMIRTNLEREDVLSDDLIEFIDVFDESGDLVHDLSFHPEAAKIEKLLLSMINKRIIKQKVTGEPLVQVSVGMYANQFSQPDLRKATKDEIKKWASTTYLLPTYHKKSNGYTAAAKVMIAMQGTYYNLFNLEYENGETIGVYDENDVLDMEQSLTRLNEKIKDDKWLDANNEANRKAITLVGVRIPVQGLNSMEFAEVFEFLPPQAGNIIIPPAEIVAKSGGDFDIDKLTIFMNTLNEEGNVVSRSYKDNNAIKKLKGTDEFFEAVKQQKAALENELIEDIKNILELPENYSSLITPNGTYLLKGIADDLAQHVMEYNPKKNKMTEDTGEISPTRIFEALYNVYKHESNIVGKKTLGLGAIENTFNVILNTLGAYMPKLYTTNEITRKSNMRLRHNKMTNSKEEEVISMSDLYDVDGVNKISDVISQMINGWVDVEKDAWIFFIQGNYEVAPTLLYLIKAGVPVREAIYFVSNPLVREYVEEQRLAKSTFADVLDKKPDSPGLAKYKAASEVIGKHFSKDELGKNSKNDDRYIVGQRLLDNLFENRKEKQFTEREMLNLIETNDINSDLAKAMFLHYLELEQQIAGYTALKMSSNPDTSTKSTISDVEQTQANIENLFFDPRVPTEIVEAMMDDSILKSFFNGPLAMAVSKPLFKLRFHKEISDYLIGKKEKIRRDLETTFPGRNIEMFSNVFRNDIVSFILQNAIRRYSAKEGFLSLDQETKIPTSLVKELKRGAFVKNGTMYIDMNQLQKEFLSKAWVKNSDAENSYEDRGLYALDPSTFMNNSQTNYDQYRNFVLHREYLRYTNPLTTEFSKSVEFKEELDNTKELFPDLTNEKAVRYTYEKLIAIRALDNAFNFYNLFQDKENSFGVRMSILLQNYPELKKQYPVLGKLKLDSDKEDTAFNLFISDKDFDNDKSNLYTQDLKKLADPTHVKVADPQENARISRMFKLMNMVSFLQTGLNKTKLSFTNVVDFTDFLTVVEDEAELFIDALDKNGYAVLDNFYDMFVNQNDVGNLFKNRFKDYMSPIDLSNPERIVPLTEKVERQAKSEELTIEDGQIYFKEDKNTGYAARTRINASADATIALAYDFNSAGEKLTRNSVESQNKQYIGIPIPEKEKATKDLKPDQRAVDFVVDKLNEVNAKTLNIAGNGIYTMREANYSQNDVDEMTYQLLKAVLESPNLKNKIESIRTGGQTGFDEAGAKAGIKLGIPTTILAPKGWKFRDISGKDISDEKAFKARFTQNTIGEVKPENISSKGSEFAKKLTNVGNTVGLTYKGKQYVNSEHAYQTWKSGEFNQAGYDLKGGKVRGGKIATGEKEIVSTTPEQLKKDVKSLLDKSLKELKKANATQQNYIIGFHGGKTFDKADRNKQYTGEFRNPEIKRIAESMGARYEGQMLFFTEALEDDFNYEQAINSATGYAIKYGDDAPSIQAYLIPKYNADFINRGVGEVGVTYDDIEADKIRKIGSVDFTRKFEDTFSIMTDILTEKLKQHPELVQGINARGGLAYIEQSTHNVIGDKFWESAGQNKFIEALAQAYKNVQSTTQPTVQGNAQTDSTNIDTVDEKKRFGLKNTNEPDVFTYNDLNAKDITFYTNLGLNNKDVVFIYNTSIYEIKPEQLNAGRNLGGSSNFLTEVGSMSVNFPTDVLINVKPNGEKVYAQPEQYNVVKEIYEKRINIIKQIKEKGGKIAFPEYGFGNSDTMPQELFVYLSKRLFEEFQYVNPGSTMYKEVSSMISESQGISDEEILMQLELEEDPFKCS